MAATAEPIVTSQTTTNPAVPVRVLVRMFDHYPDASDAVDRLRREGIAGDHVTIVGEDLGWVRDSDPGRTMGRLAAASAGIGAVVGFGTWLTGLGDGDVGLFLLLVFGAIVGLVSGVLALMAWYVATRDDPSVPETGRVQALRYDLLVDEELADRAAELLRR